MNTCVENHFSAHETYFRRKPISYLLLMYSLLQFHIR